MSSPEMPNPDDRRLWERFASARPASACPAPIDLAAYVDGRTAGEERDRLEAHLAECGACRQSVADTRLIRAQGQHPAPLRVIEAARELVAGREQRAAVVTEPRWRFADWLSVGGWSMAAAASIAIGAIGYRFGSGWPVFEAAPAEEVLLSEISFGLLGEAGEPGLDQLTRTFGEVTP